MKKVLLLSILFLASCQKDHYLDDLNSANEQIALLQGRVSQVSADLASSLEANKLNEVQIHQLSLAVQVITAEAEALQLGSYALVDEIARLAQQLRDLVDLIKAKQDQITVLLSEEKLNITKITNLITEVSVLEASTPDVITEYIAIVNEVIVTQQSLETVTVVDEERVNELEDLIADLEAQLAELPADDAGAPVDEVVEDEVDEDAGAPVEEVAIPVGSVRYLYFEQARFTSAAVGTQHVVTARGYDNTNIIEYERDLINGYYGGVSNFDTEVTYQIYSASNGTWGRNLNILPRLGGAPGDRYDSITVWGVSFYVVEHSTADLQINYYVKLTNPGWVDQAPSSYDPQRELDVELNHVVTY